MEVTDASLWRARVEPGLWLDLREALGCLTQGFVRPERRAVRLYDLIGMHNLVTEQSLFMNLGYWADAPASYDAACRAMAALVGDTARMNASDTVLDAGCGYGDASFYWMDHHRPARITALNISASQVAVAEKRVPEEHRDRMVVRQGSATDLPFEDGSFSLVIALESSQHFRTREDFLREAFRVLVPGGRLVSADILPWGEPPRFDLQAWAEGYARTMWTAVPGANWYPAPVYHEKLRAAGFGDCTMQSIASDVYRPMLDYLWRRLDEPDVRRRINRFFRPRWIRQLVMSPERIPKMHDYLIVRAHKP
jgi:ubiquinone/menaquinone biosynthesis C-methylase UbiE